MVKSAGSNACTHVSYSAGWPKHGLIGEALTTSGTPTPMRLTACGNRCFCSLLLCIESQDENWENVPSLDSKFKRANHSRRNVEIPADLFHRPVPPIHRR